MAVLDTIDNFSAPSGAMVSGMIVLWHGTLANIPAGYVLCDGDNSTPNLLDQFVQSVPDAVTDPGGTGGATSQSVSSHRHNSPNHSHSGSPGGASGTANDNATTGATEMASTTHQHYSSSTNTNGAIFGGYNTDTVTDGRPKYYQVAFIMKT